MPTGQIIQLLPWKLNSLLPCTGTAQRDPARVTGAVKPEDAMKGHET